MREVSDRNGKYRGDETHWEEYDGRDSENHDGLTLSASESSLISCKSGFECVCMLLFEIEKMSQLFSLVI